MTHPTARPVSRARAAPRAAPLDLPRRLTMLLAAGAVILAGLVATTRPARADAEDILRFLAGAIVIGAIVNAIDDNTTPRFYGRWVLPDACLETIRVNHRLVQAYNARCLNRGGYHGLPNRCRYEFRLHGGRTRVGFIAECLYEAGYRPQGGYYGDYPDEPPYVPSPPNPGQGYLPAHCEVTYRQSGQRIQGYWAHCLRDAGFRNLPGHCAVTSTQGDRIFNAQCLRNAGYGRGY